MRRKRIAAWLLCAVLALGLLPATVWADPPNVKPKAEQIKGFMERDVVQIICQDDASHNKGYALINDCFVWGGQIAEPQKKTMTVNGPSYYQNYYLKDFPDNHHVRMAGETHINIHFTWSEDEQLWVPDDPDQLPVTFYVEEVPDIYEGRLSLLDEKAVRFVPAPGNASHETVHCDRGSPSYMRVSNTHRTLSFSAWEYIGQLNAVCGGQHELVSDATGTINLNYDKTDKQWKADKTWVEFQFTCNRAELPTLEEAAALVGDVTVRCVDGHGAQTHRLQDAAAYYAEFTSDDTCRLTVYHAAFVKRFCESGVDQQHIFAPDQSDRTELALVRDAATGAWTLDSDSQSALSLTIQASCDRPAAPTEKELDRMEGAVIVRYTEWMSALSLQYKLEPGTYGHRDPGGSGDGHSSVTSSDDLTRWEYRIWLSNTWPYRERYNKHYADGNADAYRALTDLQHRISLVYDNGWRVANTRSGDKWDGRAYIMLTQTHSEHHDLNGDDDKSIGDMACLYTWLTTGVNPGQLTDAVLRDKADLNHDGTVDVYDLQLLYEHLNGLRTA